MELSHNSNVRFPKKHADSDLEFWYFNDQVIGKGAERIAYPTVNNRTGAKYVTKIPLDDHDPILTNTETCKYVVATYNTANELAKVWNHKFPDAFQVEFVKCGYFHHIEKNKYYIHEKYLDGSKFVKWNNNMGVMHPEELESDIQAFAHFVYAETHGQRMILDLQGMFYDTFDKYTLTDPAYISATPGGGVCGPTDMGNHAIKNFFTHHTPEACSRMKCKGMLRPNLSEIQVKPLGDLLPGRGGLSSQSLSIKQSYKNSGKAFLVDPKCYQKQMAVSKILGMSDQQKHYWKMQLEAIAQNAPESFSTALFDQFQAIDDKMVPNHTKGQNPKKENACGLDQQQLEDIADQWS